jgi:multidrug efflux pump subunit AcrA (membrane-fusion protein)
MRVGKTITAACVSAAFLAFGALAAQTATTEPGPQGAAAGTTSIRLRQCETRWADERTISSKIPGKIDRRLVNDGDEVYEGDPLALLDSRDAKIELAIQEILGNSELDEKGQRAKLKEYITRMETANKLIGGRVISEEEYRLAKVNVEVNQLLADKEAEKRVVEQKKADRARIYVDDHIIKSPMRGVIKKCFKREKESVTGGDLQLFSIVATDKVWVEGMVDVSELFRVKVGQEVEVQLDLSSNSADDSRLLLSPGVSSKSTAVSEPQRPNRPQLPQEKEKFHGKLVFVYPDASFSARTFQVRAEVDNKPDPESGDPILRAGLMTNMTIFLNKPQQKGN